MCFFLHILLLIGLVGSYLTGDSFHPVFFLQESPPTPQFRASVIWCSAFFIVQLSHLYMTTRKIIALTRRTFVSKVKSLLFNIQSRLVVTFLPKSKHLLISWLQSASAAILEPKKLSLSPFPLFPHLFAMKQQH